MFAGNSGIGNVEAATLIVVRVRRWAVLHEIRAVPEDRFPFGVAARHKRIRAGMGAVEVKVHSRKPSRSLGYFAFQVLPTSAFLQICPRSNNSSKSDKPWYRACVVVMGNQVKFEIVFLKEGPRQRPDYDKSVYGMAQRPTLGMRDSNPVVLENRRS